MPTSRNTIGSRHELASALAASVIEQAADIEREAQKKALPDIMKAPASDDWIVTLAGREMARFDTRGGAEQYAAKRIKEGK